MLILAGVSLNAIIGDNGIITNAQNANIKNSIAVLEEFLQETYVSSFDSMEADGKFSKLDQFRLQYPDYFYHPTETNLPYILNKGNMYYLIQKENLPKDVQESIKGGDAGGKTYQDYASFNDVYGVTSDLKVYYCANGTESRFGVADELLKDSADRLALRNYSSDSLAQNMINNYEWVRKDENGNVLAENLDSLKTLTIENGNIDSLTEIYNFSSLERLVIRNSTIVSLNGLSSAPLLNYILITNSMIGDYNGLTKCNKLESLLIDSTPQLDIGNKIGEALKNSNMTKLKYFGIYNSNVSNIDGINQMSAVTKAAIKYMYFYRNQLTSFTLESGYNALYQLELNGESSSNRNYTLTTVSLASTPELQYMYIACNSVLTHVEINAPKLYDWEGAYCPRLETPNFGNLDNLYTLYCYGNGAWTNIDFLENNKVINYINLYNAKITNIDALKNNTSIEYLGLYSSTLGKYRDISYDSSTKKYTALGKSDNNVLKVLENKINLKNLYLYNCYYLGYIGYIKNCTNLEAVQLHGCINVQDDGVDDDFIAFLDGIPTKTFPENKEATLLSTNSTTFQKSSGTLTLDEFKSISKATELDTFNWTGGIITKDGVELTEAEYNLEVNNLLEKFPKLRIVRLSIGKLSEISFVKQENANNIELFSVQYSNVGTHKTVDGANIVNENGLQLLNNNCPKLKLFNSGTGYVDVSLIQPLINKLDSTKLIDGQEIPIHSYARGFVWYDKSGIDESTFSKCSDLTNFVNVYSYGTNLDFSNCKKLSKIYFGRMVSYGKYESIALPNETTIVDDEGKPVGYEATFGILYGKIISGGKACRKLVISGYVDGTSNDFWGNFEDFKNSTILEELEIQLTTSSKRAIETQNGIASDKFNEIFSTCPNLKKITIVGYNKASSSFTSIEGLSQLKKLEYVYVTKTAISAIPDLSNSKDTLTEIYIFNNNVVNIDGLSELVNLKKLQLYDNSINDLGALVNLTALTQLYLYNNSIKATALNIKTGETDNIAALNGFKGQIAASQIRIQNNKLTDADKAQLNWITYK